MTPHPAAPRANQCWASHRPMLLSSLERWGNGSLLDRRTAWRWLFVIIALNNSKLALNCSKLALNCSKLFIRVQRTTAVVKNRLGIHKQCQSMTKQMSIWRLNSSHCMSLLVHPMVRRGHGLFLITAVPHLGLVLCPGMDFANHSAIIGHPRAFTPWLHSFPVDRTAAPHSR